MIVINGLYRHYKGNLYKVICIAKHSETLEDLVVYKDVNNPSKIWARPSSMWEDSITVNNIEIPRFKYVKS